MRVSTKCKQEEMRNAVGNDSTELVRKMCRDVQECSGEYTQRPLRIGKKYAASPFNR
jgi:hypothetical protein